MLCRLSLFRLQRQITFLPGRLSFAAEASQGPPKHPSDKLQPSEHQGLPDASLSEHSPASQEQCTTTASSPGAQLAQPNSQTPTPADPGYGHTDPSHHDNCTRPTQYSHAELQQQLQHDSHSHFSQQFHNQQDTDAPPGHEQTQQSNPQAMPFEHAQTTINPEAYQQATSSQLQEFQPASDPLDASQQEDGQPGHSHPVHQPGEDMSWRVLQKLEEETQRAGDKSAPSPRSDDDLLREMLFPGGAEQGQQGQQQWSTAQQGYESGYAPPSSEPYRPQVPRPPKRAQWEEYDAPTAAETEAADEAASNFAPKMEPEKPAVYKTLRSKTFGMIEVPEDLPLPGFITGVKKVKREPINILDALKEVQEYSSKTKKRKFDETVEIALNLGVDPRKGTQMVRGAATLPFGTGKTIKIAVFTTGPMADQAKAAGADIVAAEELIEKIRVDGSSAIEFDKCLATPDIMPKLGKIARILGPRGLMPNPKVGTVVTDVVAAIKTLRQGRVEFRVDKGGVLHAGFGKVSFDAEKLHGNVGTLVSTLINLRPKGLKGSGASGYILSAAVSSTMGKSVPVTVPSLLTAAQVAKRL